MIRLFFSSVVTISLLAAAATVQAVDIKYNENGRPVVFSGLMVNGEPYFVTVSWRGNMASNYGPESGFSHEFFGDATGANLAVEAMRQALLDDGFVNTDISPLIASYLWVPVVKTQNGWYDGPGCYLHTAGLDVAAVNVYYNRTYGTVGYTKFNVFQDGFEGESN